MSSGRDAPPDDPDADRKRGFDDAWTALLDAPPPAAAAATPPAAEPAKTLAWDDAARAEGLPAQPQDGDAAASDAAPDPADSVSGLADELHVGRTAEPDVALGGGRDHDATMATMMSGSWAMATRDASPTAASGNADPQSGKDLRESDAEMAAIMGAEQEAAVARHREAKGPAKVVAKRPASEENSEPARGDDDSKPIDKPRTAPRRMVAPEPRRSTGRTAIVPEQPSGGGKLSLGWAAAFGVLIAGAIWWFQQPKKSDTPLRAEEKRVAANDTRRTPKEDTKPSDRTSTPTSVDRKTVDAKIEAPPEDDPPPKDEPPPKPEPPKPVPEIAKPEPVTPTKPATTPTKPSGDPRTPPAGTPPEIAAVFVRLPVSPADLPPVGGVGATGVHVDRVEMGASYDKTGCGGVADRFSLAGIDRVNVCLRVVHPRQEETLSIVWSKNDNSTARRGKIAIKPLHAYRTRAYLVLRKEYVGDWTVRIMSADGVELASHAFTITP
ncbi:MAG TPA: DUF2914 domain-containing protein [Nannocystaceae bacterium]|nr:DUF2914 domain-containing protein [Nannocystaceae bacterium]